MAADVPVERPLLRRRPLTEGPEQRLLAGALVSFCAGFRSPSVVLQEVQLPTGVPDAIAVLLRRGDVELAHERLGLSRDDLRLFQHIASIRKTTVDDLALALRWGAADLRRAVTALEAAGLVHETTRRVQARRLSDIFLARQIIAIEAKMSDWQRALRQAIGNTWFASHSYILLPDRRLPREVLTEAARFGVGVLTFDGQKTRTRLRALARKLPASYGSWLVHESALRVAQASR
jgi:predicted transcriptional regulator